ncbi:MAG: GNAT family N-acetyltransferase [Cytophagales bacterium]|nr:GNAT family N-acetyltransferase [Bernardetiaceae bacterium]MDW8203818.1 GNAT family N-acetyltransferase [Cytophagales bacterium]
MLFVNLQKYFAYIMIKVTHIQPNDLPQILELQRANLREYVSADVQQSQGFVVARYDMPFLERLYAVEPPIVAYHNHKVVGYCLPTPLEVATTSDFLRTTAEMVATLYYHDKPLTAYRYCLMGQICIAESHRGIGLFDQLYLFMRKHLQGRYELVVTEVSYRNHRSLRAHQRIGYEIIHSYNHDEHWAVVVWKL